MLPPGDCLRHVKLKKKKNIKLLFVDLTNFIINLNLNAYTNKLQHYCFSNFINVPYLRFSELTNDETEIKRKHQRFYNIIQMPDLFSLDYFIPTT